MPRITFRMPPNPTFVSALEEAKGKQNAKAVLLDGEVYDAGTVSVDQFTTQLIVTCAKTAKKELRGQMNIAVRDDRNPGAFDVLEVTSAFTVIETMLNTPLESEPSVPTNPAMSGMELAELAKQAEEKLAELQAGEVRTSAVFALVDPVVDDVPDTEVEPLASIVPTAPEDRPKASDGNPKK